MAKSEIIMGELGGGTKEVQYKQVSLTNGVFTDIGIKSDDAIMLSIECASMYPTFIKDSNGNWSLALGSSSYYDIQVNSSGNIELKFTYGGNAKIYYV